LNTKINSIDNNTSMLVSLKYNIETLKEEKMSLSDEMVSFLENIGNLCPLCNSKIAHNHILEES
jgi:uncharacterized protein YdcH (DUF465 family)